MSSFLRHLVILFAFYPTHNFSYANGFTPEFLSKGINLHALYDSVCSGFSSLVANFFLQF